MKKQEYTASELRICIDDIKEREIQGRIYGIAVEKEMFFSCSSELLVMIDRLLDGIGKPQSSRKTRSFRDSAEETAHSYCVFPRSYHSSEEIREKHGKIMTRDVFFLSRLRSSWQGVMKDDQGKLLGQFDSELEFIDLLYDCGVTGGNYTILGSVHHRKDE